MLKNGQKIKISMMARAKRRKSKGNLLLIPVSIFGIGFFAYYYGEFIQFYINSDAIALYKFMYIYREWNILGILMIFAIGIPSLSLGFIMTNFTLGIIKPIRKIFEEEAKGYKGTSFKSTQKTLAKTFLISFLVGLPFIYLRSKDYVYLHDSMDFARKENIIDIEYSPWYNLRVYKYSYDDILERKIKISKPSDRQSVRLSFQLIMKDGKKIEIAEQNEWKFLKWYRDSGFKEKTENKKITLDYISLSAFDKFLNLPGIANNHLDITLCEIIEPFKDDERIDGTTRCKYIIKNHKEKD